MTPKITPANLCKTIHDIINYSTSIFPLESRKCGKEGEKIQKFEYLEKEKSKKHFSLFLKGYYLVKRLKFGKK